VLRKLPGRERGGKPVILAITAEAASKLKRKAQSQNRGGSVLARRAIRQVIRWVEESPAEALDKIREESRFYEPKHLGDYRGFQVYIEAKTKRRLKRAREILRDRAKENLRSEKNLQPEKNLKEGRKEDFGRLVTQGDILQFAARLAIESEASRPRPLAPPFV